MKTGGRLPRIAGNITYLFLFGLIDAMLLPRSQFVDLFSGCIKMSAIERLKENSDRAKVNAWLDHIQEFDEACRKEVLDQCAKDKDARTFYVGLYRRDCEK